VFPEISPNPREISREARENIRSVVEQDKCHRRPHPLVRSYVTKKIQKILFVRKSAKEELLGSRARRP
jgi:hypothetical protein